MSSSQKFCLIWSDFEKNITNSFHDMRDENNFTNVTLVCRDKKEIEAHNVSLAASSSFFKNLLIDNKGRV